MNKKLFCAFDNLIKWNSIHLVLNVEKLNINEQSIAFNRPHFFVSFIQYDHTKLNQTFNLPVEFD